MLGVCCRYFSLETQVQRCPYRASPQGLWRTQELCPQDHSRKLNRVPRPLVGTRAGEETHGIPEKGPMFCSPVAFLYLGSISETFLAPSSPLSLLSSASPLTDIDGHPLGPRQ